MSKDSPSIDLINRGQSTVAVMTEKSKPSAGASLNPVQVRDVEELYNAVNDPMNVGVTIELQSGFYALSPNDPNGSPRLNGVQPDDWPA